jgi:hypothetical protein
MPTSGQYESQAREHIGLATIGQDNCTMAEHAQTVALQGIGLALLAIYKELKELHP